MFCTPSCCCHSHFTRIRECNIIKTSPQCSSSREDCVIIVNPQSGMVLDASCYEVKLKCYTGCSSQLWYLECSQNGNFFIVNVGNEKVLDIQGGVKSSANLITYEKHGGDNQQWLIDHCDNTISNPCDDLVVDVFEQRFCCGTNVIAYTKHGGPNQKFCLQYV